jgi:small subunit ribosomal protein S6
MTRDYEAVYVFDSTLEDEAIADRLARFHGLLNVGEAATLDHWGRRQLAYQIGRRDTGYYVIARFGAYHTNLPEYERALKLDDGVVRYLVTLYENELGAPPMTEEEMAEAARRRAAEEDEEEDE